MASLLFLDSPVLHITLYHIRYALGLLLLLSLFRFLTTLVHHVLKFSARKCDSSSIQPTQIPHVNPTIPKFGHLLGFQWDSARYVNRLLARTAAPVFSISMAFKDIIMVKPSMDRELAKHAGDLGLGQFAASTVGKSIFGLTDEGVRMVMQLETKPMFHAAFLTPDNLRLLVDDAAGFVADKLATMPDEKEVDVGDWIFELSATATAHALWGPDNPWCQDPEFMRQFRILGETYDTLYLPLPWLTARKGHKARAYLLSRLRARPVSEQAAMHRLNVVAMADAAGWAANTDYYAVELLMALAILSTLATLTVWLVRHLLAQPGLLRQVTDEVDELSCGEEDDDNTTTTTTSRIDLARLRATCPLLVASWHETLRLHMTGVGRQAKRPFTLAGAGPFPPVRVDAGAVLLLPMCASNQDAAAWGADAALFAPRRFLEPGPGPDGGGRRRLSARLARRVRAFGVAGNLCPGRHFGFDTAMALVVGLLLHLEVRDAGAGGAAEERGAGTRAFAEPRVLGGFSGGFERYADDVRARLVRRPGWKGRRVEFVREKAVV